MEPFTLGEADGRKEGPAASLHIFLVPTSASNLSSLSLQTSHLSHLSLAVAYFSFLSQEIHTIYFRRANLSRVFLFLTNIPRYVSCNYPRHPSISLARSLHRVLALYDYSLHQALQVKRAAKFITGLSPVCWIQLFRLYCIENRYGKLKFLGILYPSILFHHHSPTNLNL